jgi:hypothetical protein
MNENVPTELTSELSDFVDDRPQDGVFRVNRQIYNDPDILVAEFQQIFENGWVFLCRERQAIMSPQPLAGNPFLLFAARMEPWAHKLMPAPIAALF